MHIIKKILKFFRLDILLSLLIRPFNYIYFLSKFIFSNFKLQNIEDVIDIYDKYLIIAPHPDDEIIGCGGLINKLSIKGKEIKIVYLTSGEAIIDGCDKFIRENESKAVLEKYNIIDFEFLRLKEKNISLAETDIFNNLKSFKPDVVCFTHHLDSHSDHSIVPYLIKKTGLNRISNKMIYFIYESQSPLTLEHSTHFLDFSSDVQEKINSLNLYNKSLLRNPQKMLLMNKYYALSLGKIGYIELYRKVSVNYFYDLPEKHLNKLSIPWFDEFNIIYSYIVNQRLKRESIDIKE